MSSVSDVSEKGGINEEIASLKEQGTLRLQASISGVTDAVHLVALLRKSLRIETSTILSSSTVADTLSKAKSTLGSARRNDQSRVEVLAEADKQKAYAQQCLYRICSSVTSFKVRDPDPNAVDDGNVLGLRLEVMSKGQFLRPYYVMLNRPYFNSKYLRIHRHTVPPAIPLAGLAARYLPSPRPESSNPPQQNLDRFVRNLRREIVRYHNRLGVSADLRRNLRLHELTHENVTPGDIVDIGIADIEAKHIRLSWADDRNGRINMDDDGKVQKFMVFGPEGRDWESTKELHGENERIEEVAAKLRAYAKRRSKT